MTPLPESVAHAMHEMAVPAKPDAAFLSAVLRAGPSGEHWPAGFVYDWHEPSQCALGLATHLWECEWWTHGARLLWLQDELGLSYEATVGVFVNISLAKNRFDGITPTPSEIADALDAAIAAKVEA